KPRHLEHNSQSCARTMIMIGSRVHVDWRVGRIVLLDDQYLVPALLRSSVEQTFDLAELIGEDWCWNRPVALPVPLAAHRGRWVHDHEHCRQPGFAGESLVVSAPHRIQSEGVYHCRERASGSRRDDLIEQRERLHSTIPGGSAAND